MRRHRGAAARGRDTREGTKTRDGRPVGAGAVRGIDAPPAAGQTRGAPPACISREAHAAMSPLAPATGPAAPRAPLCHVFAIDGRHFVYDAHTHGLLEVEPALGAVLPRYGVATRRELVAELAPRFGVAAVRAAFDAVERGRRERGLFLARRPRLVPPPAALAAPGVCDRDLRAPRADGDRALQPALPLLLARRRSGLGQAARRGRAARGDRRARHAAGSWTGRARTARRSSRSTAARRCSNPSGWRRSSPRARAHRRGAEVRFVADTNGVLLDDRAVDLVVTGTPVPAGQPGRPGGRARSPSRRRRRRADARAPGGGARPAARARPDGRRPAVVRRNAGAAGRRGGSRAAISPRSRRSAATARAAPRSCASTGPTCAATTGRGGRPRQGRTWRRALDAEQEQLPGRAGRRPPRGGGPGRRRALRAGR